MSYVVLFSGPAILLTAAAAVFLYNRWKNRLRHDNDNNLPTTRGVNGHQTHRRRVDESRNELR